MHDLLGQDEDSKEKLKLSAYKYLSLLVDWSYLFLPKLTHRPLSSFDNPLVKLLLTYAGIRSSPSSISGSVTVASFKAQSRSA